MTTKDEALRVAREALEQISKVGYGLDSSDDDAAQADYWAGKAIHQRDLARSALRTIALAVEAPSLPTTEELERLYETTHYGHEADFAADVLERWGGWMPGLLGYGGALQEAVKIHAQRTAAVQSVALGEPGAASGAVGETAEPNASQLIDELEWAVLARSQGVPGSADKLHEAKQAIREALARLPGTSNDQQKGGA